MIPIRKGEEFLASDGEFTHVGACSLLLWPDEARNFPPKECPLCRARERVGEKTAQGQATSKLHLKIDQSIN